MDLGLNDKVALVTGGSQGIGLACAQVLAQEGVKAVICGRSQSKLDSALEQCAKAGLSLYGMPADVTDGASMERLFRWIEQEFGQLDILVNNAGRGSPGAALSLAEETWQNVLDTNLTSVWRCSKLAAPLLARRGGVIINISSMSARIAYTHQGAYPVAKAGVNALTKIMASELASKGIRVVAVAPGFTETEMLNKKYGNTDHLKDAAILRRLATPEEVGQLVAFLASDAAQFITAEIFELSGGAFQVRDPEYSWRTK